MHFREDSPLLCNMNMKSQEELKRHISINSVFHGFIFSSLLRLLSKFTTFEEFSRLLPKESMIKETFAEFRNKVAKERTSDEIKNLIKIGEINFFTAVH